MMILARTAQIAAFLFVTACLCVWPCAVAMPADEVAEVSEEKLPRAVVEKAYLDVGDIAQGEKAVARFVIRNAGTDVLSIERVEAAAEELTVKVSETRVEPGEETIVEAVLDTGGRQGKVERRITVITNDPQNRAIHLAMAANVRPLLAFDVPFIFAGQLAKEDTFVGKARLMGTLFEKDEPPELEIIKSTAAIEATIERRPTKDGTVSTLEFVLLSELKAGTFRESIAVVCADPPARTQLMIVGQKLGDIKVTPDRLHFFQRQGEEVGPGTVEFESDKVFHITKTEDLTQLLDISIETVEEGKKYRLKATLKNPLEESLLGVVKVHTDLEQHPLIHIPVVGGRLSQN